MTHTQHQHLQQTQHTLTGAPIGHSTAVPLGQISGFGCVYAEDVDVIVADEGELLLCLCAEQLVKQMTRSTPVPERLHHVLQQLLHVPAQVQQHVTRLTLTITGQQLQRLMGRLLSLEALGFGSRSLREKRMKTL